MKEKPDVLQGTLALMVLKTLDVLGPQHGYGIARRIEQISGDVLAVNQGTLYPLLLKLEKRPEHRNSLVELVLPHLAPEARKEGAYPYWFLMKIIFGSHVRDKRKRLK